MMSRTLLVHPLVSEGTQLMKDLRDMGLRVTWTRSMPQSLGFASLKDEFDVAILDCASFVGNEIAMVKAFRKSAKELPLLVVSAMRALQDRMALIEAGADDCVMKPANLLEVVTRAKSLSRRFRSSLEGVESVFGAFILNPLEHVAEFNGQRTKLTTREYALLRELVAAHGRVVPRATLMSRVWGPEDPPTDTALDYFVHMLRKKLGRHTIRTVVGVGYAFDYSELELPHEGTAPSLRDSQLQRNPADVGFVSALQV